MLRAFVPSFQLQPLRGRRAVGRAVREQQYRSVETPLQRQGSLLLRRQPTYSYVGRALCGVWHFSFNNQRPRPAGCSSKLFTSLLLFLSNRESAAL